MLSASPCRQKCMQGDQGYMETAVHKEIQGGFIAHTAAKKKKKKKSVSLTRLKGKRKHQTQLPICIAVLDVELEKKDIRV